MHFEQMKTHAALRHVQTFLDVNNNRLTEVNAGGARTALNEVVQSIEDLASQQDPTRLQRDKQSELERGVKAELREMHMQPIARIAQLKLRGMEGFEQLRLPHKTVDTPTLVRWGREMAKAAVPYTDTFVAHGLASDFSAKLLEKADQAQKVIDSRWHIRSKAVGATDGLRKETRRALGVLRVIDALVAPKLADDNTLAREWQFTKKVVRKAARAVVAEAVPGTPDAAPAVPTPPVSAQTTASKTASKPASSKEAVA
jgi:hypothetical protein